MRTSRMTRALAALLLAVFFMGFGAQALAADTISSGKAPKTELGERHKITKRDYITYIGPTADDVLIDEFPLYFVDGVDDLPYVEARDWAEMLYFLYTEAQDDPGYDLSYYKRDSSFTLERENGYSLTFDFLNDKLVFDDYDAFIHDSEDTTLVDLVSEKGRDENGAEQLIQRDTKASFDRYGDSLTVDLGAYGIHMLAQDGKYLIPLQTLNDFTLLPLMLSFVFNGKALFLANDNIFFDYDEGDYTEIAELYYSAPTGDRSDALAEYSYNELCLALDTFYGLKENHDITSFRELFYEIGFDEALSGSDPFDADNALKAFIDFYLDDLHSVFNEYSWLSGINPIYDSTGMANRKFDEHAAIYAAARDAAYPDGWLSYEEVGNTAYITFDSFISDYSGFAFYDAKESGERLDDTVGLIIYAHEQITREGSPIENVVLDLSNNTGGAVDAAAVVLSWMLGDASLSVKDMATGAMSNAVYRADVNLDQRFDKGDTVSDKKLYCLISPVSFSCGNLVPAALKSSQKVTLLGRTTGGGSCVVQPMTTAYGTLFQVSSSLRMSFLKNGSFYDIDQGVEPDYYIDNIAHYYDRQALTDYINSLF